MRVKPVKANEKLVVTEIKKVKPRPPCCHLPVLPLCSLGTTDKLCKDSVKSGNDVGHPNPQHPHSWGHFPFAWRADKANAGGTPRTRLGTAAAILGTATSCR